MPDIMNTSEASVRPASFTVGAVISEAWEKVSGSKGLCWMGLFYIFIVSFGVSLLAAIVGAVIGETAGPIVGLLLQLVGSIILISMQAGWFMLAVRNIRGEAPRAKEVFSYINRSGALILLIIISGILISLGFVLLIIPGIYLMLAYFLAIPALVDKNLGAWEALETSRKASTKHWFKIFFIMLIMTIIMFISAIPLGIGLIWTLPMQLNVIGILYREVIN